MKKIIALIAIILLTYLKSFTQVSSVNYWINYNDTTSLFDCHIIINQDTSTSAIHRALFNSQYSIVTPQGSIVSIDSLYNPLYDNQFYNGTEPANWIISHEVDNPISSPGNKFISIIPSSLGVFFNNLYPTDTVKLFSLNINPSLCPNSIRNYKNGIDPNSEDPGMDNYDFNNSFSIGGGSQDYNDNSPQGGFQSPIGQLPNISPVVGDEFLLIPNYSGTWVSNNPSVATVDENGLVDVINTGYVTFSFTNSFGCENTTHALFIPEPEPPVIVLDGPEILCVNDTIALAVIVIAGSPPFTYLWSNGSTNDSIEVSPLNNTNYSVTVSDNFGNSTIAYHAIDVYPLPVISISGSDSICIGETTTLSPNSSGVWVSSNNAIANITNTGVVTGISGGKVSFTFTSNSTGCSSLPSDSVTIHDLPNVVLIGQDIIFVNDSTFLSPQAGGTWASSDNDIAIISDDGIVTGISPGFVTFTYTSNTTNCSATSQAVQILNQHPSFTCNVGTIVFSNQDEVDDFPSNYTGCTIIEGNVGITGTVNNLDSLIQITKIIGSVSILNTNNLNDLNGLNNVARIGGSLSINGLNPQITNLSYFTSLDFVGGNIDISFSNINSFSGFSELDTIGQSIIMVNLATNNIDLSGINDLDYVGNSLLLRNIINFGSINNLDTIRGTFELYSPLTSDLDFPNLRKIQGSFNIRYSNTLTQISGFNQLNSVGFIWIYDNPFLSSISGFDHTFIEFSANINNCPFLTHCNIEPVCLAIWSNPNKVNFTNNGIGCSSIQEIQALCSSAPDSDNDGINDYQDNCILIPNSNQLDTNNDGEGDVCDSNSDSDNDNIIDSLDNCVNNFNTNQADANNDGEGDACDHNSDTDGDGQMDANDNCINIPNPNQADANNDGEGNFCDSDSDTDSDGSVDSLDNCVTIFNPNQADINNDGEGDVCDINSDSDGDGKIDNIDNCPSIFNPDQRDCNNNGIGDVCEAFVDNDCDGIANSGDNCPETYNPYQLDYNNNSIGDACENFPKVGFNTTQPKTEMHLSYSNLYLDHPEKGLIVKGNTGICYKTTVEIVNNKPELKLVQITCP